MTKVMILMIRTSFYDMMERSGFFMCGNDQISRTNMFDLIYMKGFEMVRNNSNLIKKTTFAWQLKLNIK